MVVNVDMSYTHVWSSNQGNQDSSGKQNVIQEQRPDMENWQTQQRT